ncbi:MAG: ABC transporter substrate-binding protein [Anaerolineales bacterium]
MKDLRWPCRHKKIRLRLALGMAFFLLAGCRGSGSVDLPLTLVVPTSTEQVFQTPTPPPPPPETLIICMNQEPESLFIYSDAFVHGETAPQASSVLQAIYDGPYDLIDYRLQPVILRETPSLENGLVRIEPVDVAESDVYLNPATMQAENLRIGDPYLPPGCRGLECVQQYTGGDVSMERMQVEFHLQDGWRWSDGQPLLAADSVFSYSLDSSGEIPTTKYRVDRTASYAAGDDLTLVWTGIPGYFDPDFGTLFWQPLPEHQLASLAPAELLGAEQAGRNPLGWGPYMIDSWQAGERITLVPNPYYRRAEETARGFDRLVYRFIGDDSRSALQQLLTGECDLLDESTLSPLDGELLSPYLDDGSVKISWAPAPEISMLLFDTAPIDRAGKMFFQAAAVRQGVAACLDRSGLAASLFGDYATLPQTFLPPDHPDAASESVLPSFDPEAGAALIRSAGWVEVEDDPGGPRVSWGVAGVYNGSRFQVELLTTEGAADAALGAWLQRDLAACGIEVSLRQISSDEWLEPWPAGPVFGRTFDMTGLRWPIWMSPVCEMLAAREIPNDSNPFGVNASGYNDLAYSQACDRLLLGGYDPAVRTQAMQVLQEAFGRDLPALPLYQAPRWVVFEPDLCGVQVQSLPVSALWNIENFARGQNCLQID